MEIEWKEKNIELKKEINSLDLIVFDFTKILEEIGIKYVLVSGYVAILFGRSRSSEDIDIIMQTIDESAFSKLWGKLTKLFWCLNSSKIDEAFKDYLKHGLSLRFAYENQVIPNVEIKVPKNELDTWTLEWRQAVKINTRVIYISPLELQIPFKLFLGSQKDIEDARYLNNLFKGNLNSQTLHSFARKLKIEQKLRELL